MMDVTKIVYLVLSITFSSILFFVVTPWVFSDLNEYRLKKSTKTFSKKESIILVDGICDFGNSNTINTSNNFKKNYVDIPPSVNKEGGTEFSYTFWLKLDSALGSDVVLFTKGIKPPTVGSLKDKFSKIYDKTGKVVDDNENFIKCPMVKASTQNLTVSFNTAKKIHNEVKFYIDDDNKNLLISSENNPRWFLFTITFKEGDYETDYGMNTKGVLVNLYVNEQHVQNKFIENDTINLNKGNMYIFPDTTPSGVAGCQIGNINYYNWNLNSFEVKSVFTKGINKGGCSASGTKVVNSQFNSLTRHGASLLF